MFSLAFMCSSQLVSDHRSLRSALPLIPDHLYPLLFRAAFLGEKRLVVQDLVERWPFSALSLPRLLRGEGHHRPVLLSKKDQRMCAQAIILGLIAQLKQELTRQKEGQPLRKTRLRLLDMTGIRDNVLKRGLDPRILCLRRFTLAKPWNDIAKGQSEEIVQVAKRRRGRRRGHKNAVPSSAVDYSTVCVEVRADLFVKSASYTVLRKALLVGNQGPLRLQCRDIQMMQLSLRSTVGLLELLNPSCLRQIDLQFNNLGLPDLNALLPYMTRFSHLQSLMFPYSKMSSVAEEDLQNFASQICELPALKELGFGFSWLSGCLHQLLSGLQTPLESLELGCCYVLPADLYYLSQSSHVSSLKKLDLTGNDLCDVLLQPFLKLLDCASTSLLHLRMIDCNLNDSALSVLTPVLSRCCNLRYIGLFHNPLSCQAIRTLLQSLLHLADLQLVIIPYPVECYLNPTAEPDTFNDVDYGQVAVFQHELQEALIRAQRTDMVWTPNMVKHQAPEYLDL